MEYCDSGVNKYMIGIPSDEEREQLKNDGYTHMSNGVTADKENPEKYEIWIK